MSGRLRAAWSIAALCVPLLWAAAVPAEDAIPVVRFQVDRFEVEGENPLTPERTAAALDPFLGEHAGLEGLLSAADALEKALRESGYSFHRVSLPGQTMQGGVVRLEIIEFKIGAIEITGNEHFSDENMRRSIPELAVGRAPNTKRLARNLAMVNRHPAKTVTATFADSKEERRLVAGVKVTDEKPWNVFASFDNSGTDTTGDYRLSFGGQYNNLWNRDHAVTLTYTTSPDHTDDVKQWGVFYRAPLYGMGTTVSGYYSKSNVDSGTLSGVNGGAFDVSGAGEFAGARGRYHLLKRGRLDQSVSLAIDDKLFINDAIFQGVNTAVDVRSRPLTLGWQGEVKGARSLLYMDATLSANLSGGSQNDDATYSASRLGASSSWNATRGRIGYDLFFPGGWLLRTSASGQYAGEPLIAGEQFGLGGQHSVRGFDDRAATGDDGYRASGEIWAPPIAKLPGVRFLGFLDGGKVFLHDQPPGVPDAQSLSSMGLGVRYQHKKWIAASVDVAQVISGGTQVVPAPVGFTTRNIENPGDIRAQFTIFIRY